MLYVVILATIIILGIIFGRRHDDSKSDYKPEEFKHSGRQWAFNGILDIDHPPLDDKPFRSGEQPLQLMVKKGYVHYGLLVDESVGDDQLGLFRAQARAASPNTIDILRQGRVVGRVEAMAGELHRSIVARGGTAEAYAFIAATDQKGTLYGEVCIAKK